MIEELSAEEQTCGRFVEALTHLDFAALQNCLSEDVAFRALVPPGFREATGAADTASMFKRWFGDVEDVRVVSSSIDRIGNRYTIRYELNCVEGGVPYSIAQAICCDVSDRGITSMDLLCSGFIRQW
jgi:hypothetical protein